MKGDYAAMGAYADYLEERDGDKAFIVGLRFCVKYMKFPDYCQRSSGGCSWNCSKTNKISKNVHRLPLFLDILVFTEYRSPKLAITAVGRSILQIQKVCKEII